MFDKGIMYVATGNKFLLEAEQSANSFKKHMPDIPIALFTDNDASVKDKKLFNKVLQINNPVNSFEDKILTLKASPFSRTLFVDTDTRCVAPCNELFDILDSFDFAAAHAPVRYRYGFTQTVCPTSFPEFNTGVIVFKKGTVFEQLINKWHKIYHTLKLLDKPPPHDQQAFREAVFTSSVRFSVLTPEYNFRTNFPCMIGGNASVKIIHDRGQSLEQALILIQIDAEKHHRRPRIIQTSEQEK